jgi:protein-L-isoaspartate(D-aspartate) O-methyltransferase
MRDVATERELMVRHDIAARGIRNPRVLAAMRSVPRERFLPDDMVEFAYADTPLPIEEGQTISQPFIVANMIATIEPDAGDRVLEIGTGSGYAAAVLSRVVGEVYTVERHEPLARLARERLADLGMTNVQVLHGDGTLGWPAHAPYDAIIVTAGGPRVPESLRAQLAIGGRLVMPVGDESRIQQLIRVTRVDANRFEEESLGEVRFVPLIGQEGFSDPEVQPPVVVGRTRSRSPVAALVGEVCEPVSDIETVRLGPMLERIGDARVVLLGEASHGTSEFYAMRARITKELITRRGFTIVAVEADWPDAAQVDRYVRHRPPVGNEPPAFSRFPTWMWRNGEVHDFVEWLRAWNAGVADPGRRTGFYGLDLYSLFTSIAAVLRYLDDVDPDTAAVARRRYGCLSPWEQDPAVYGRAAVTGKYQTCEVAVTRMLTDMLARRVDYATRDGERFFDAAQNARLVAQAERYYRVMYYGRADSWNLRDRHMFDTLRALLQFQGPESRAVVWAHNSHLGNAAATEMSMRGEFNVGQLAREAWQDGVYAVGFGTDHGTVAAANDWDEPMQIMPVRPAHPESYERVFHESGVPVFALPLRYPSRAAVREELTPPRLERAIGVVYRPDTELQSHYFQAMLPRQFDEYLWFDETRAVRALPATPSGGVPDTYPFGL